MVMLLWWLSCRINTFTLYLFLASVSTAVAMIAAWSGAYFTTYTNTSLLHIVPWIGEFRAGD